MAPDLVTSVVVDAIDAPLKTPRRRGRVMEIAALGVSDAVVLALAALFGGWLVRAEHHPSLRCRRCRADRWREPARAGHPRRLPIRAWAAVARRRAQLARRALRLPDGCRRPRALLRLATRGGCGRPGDASGRRVHPARAAGSPACCRCPAARRPAASSSSARARWPAGSPAGSAASTASRSSAWSTATRRRGRRSSVGSPTWCELVDEHRVDQVLVTFSRTPGHDTLEILRKLNHRVSVSVVPRMFEMLSWRSSLEEIDGIPLLHVAPASLSTSARDDEACARHRGRRADPVRPLAGVLATAVAIRLDSGRTDLLPPAAVGPARRAVPDRQVPHDGGRRR